MYSAHMGSLPNTLGSLTALATNSLSQQAGPCLASLPTPPAGWGSSYSYAAQPNGTYTISRSGDGTTVSIP
jgi:hypothetical protein